MAKTYRKAKSLNQLLKQIDAMFPGRSKASDGWIGDVAHQGRKSDHNPNSAGVVTAIDVTNDRETGPSGDWLSKALFSSKDPRIKYIIWNRRITKAGLTGWKAYSGTNPHDHHVHISVASASSAYDDAAEWDLGESPAADPVLDPKPFERTLKEGMDGNDVARLQHRLVELGYLSTSVFGHFREQTLSAVKRFQKDKDLKVDGIVGTKTKKELKI